MRKVLIITITVLAFTCCSKRKDLNPESEEKHHVGSFKLSADAYESTLDLYHKTDDIYDLKWTFANSDLIVTGFGVEKSGYFGFGDAWDSGFVGIYKLDGNEITGLLVHVADNAVVKEKTIGAKELELSSPDLAGVWEEKVTRDDGDKSAIPHEIKLEKKGDLWYISNKSEGQNDFKWAGIGLTVENMLITGTDFDFAKIVTIYTVDGDTLHGRWIVKRPDGLTRTGTRTAVRKP